MYCGIDLGSRKVKIVLLNLKGELESFYEGDSIDFYRQRGRMKNGQLVLDLEKIEGIPLEEVTSIVATGYGRETVKIKGALVIPEIKAHVLGAKYLAGKDNFTLLDLGGQDSKVALVKAGKMIDFVTNDKCAASTGRYLENMSKILEIDLEELSLYSDNPVDLNATCAIFGETELIGKLVEGYSLERLAAGVNYTIFKRIKPMLHRLLNEVIVFTGGVARNKALVNILERELKIPVIVPNKGYLAGAYGCAFLAKEKEEA